MKRLLLLPLFILVVLLRGFSQPATVKSLPDVLVESSSDSLRYIERLAALKFHKILNDYRQEKGKHPLLWNETLWLTCYNHNIWMDESGTLSHQQKSGTKHFSGDGPGQRYAYAAGGLAPYGWSGENALYNFSGYGKSADEIAHNIAHQSLKQWIRSPGHHENLLSEKHAMHGTAFRISTSGKVWGTDLFASCSSCPADEQPSGTPVLAANSNNKPESKPTIQDTQIEGKPATVSSKPKKFNAYKATADLREGLYGLHKLKPNKAMERAASEHAEYLAAAKKPSSVQNPDSPRFYAKTPYARALKASGGMFLFTRGGKNIKEDFVILEADIQDFDADRLLSEAVSKLGEISGERSRVGLGISLKRKKDKVKLVVVRVTC